jgi:hypothetical protein
MCTDVTTMFCKYVMLSLVVPATGWNKRKKNSLHTLFKNLFMFE